MKQYKFLAVSLAAALALSSCSLDTETYDYKTYGDPYTTLSDAKSSLTGTYYWTGSYYFLGNYATSLGDFVSGVSAGSSSSGHMYAYSSFTFTETSEELEYMWYGGYHIIAAATNGINDTQALITSGAVTESNQPEAYNYIAQFYGQKALAEFYLVNYFALPYSEANKSQLGIINIDKEVPAAFAEVSRGTLEESYNQIKNDVAAAEEAFEKAGSSAESSAFYINPAAVQALKARVYMALGDYSTAETAAKQAIALKGTGNGDATDATPSNASYLSMWQDFKSETDEDIFSIVKSADDNLSANSLNTLYGSYWCSIQNNVTNLFAATDIRTNLFINSDEDYFPKFYGGADNAAVANIPVFRKSEMSLIIAECEARIGSVSEAQNYLFYTAKRNTAIASTSDLPSTSADLLKFIAEERVREFFGEGHRFFDARRTGEVISGDNFSNWDIQKFVFPIPSGEINAGFGCQQNDGWSDNLPI